MELPFWATVREDLPQSQQSYLFWKWEYTRRNAEYIEAFSRITDYEDGQFERKFGFTQVDPEYGLSVEEILDMLNESFKDDKKPFQYILPYDFVPHALDDSVHFQNCKGKVTLEIPPHISSTAALAVINERLPRFMERLAAGAVSDGEGLQALPADASLPRRGGGSAPKRLRVADANRAIGLLGHEQGTKKTWPMLNNPDLNRWKHLPLPADQPHFITLANIATRCIAAREVLSLKG